MRLRNKPWANEKIKENSHIVMQIPTDEKGNWNKIFGNSNPVHLEVGTGKGRFITEMAKLYPEVNFIGVEKFRSVIVDALDKVTENDLKNVRLLNIDAKLLPDVFAENELSQVYLNFSDPWPKNRHEKRRLTYKSFLTIYEHIMKPGGEIHIKTDNRGLFEYSLESFSSYGMLLKNISLHLHKSNMENNVKTEYEEKFSKKGSRIFRCEAQFQNK